jgi:hypothetical protein
MVLVETVLPRFQESANAVAEKTRRHYLPRQKALADQVEQDYEREHVASCCSTH